MRLVQKLITHTSGGILSKGWYKDSGRQDYLVKGNSFGNREWLSEVVASRVAGYLYAENYHFLLRKGYMTIWRLFLGERSLFTM